MLLVKGFASTSAIDSEDHCFSPDAIRWPAHPVELLYRHQPHNPCGKIRVLERRDGGLWCEATVTDAYAKREFTGFSVATRIQKYEIKRTPQPHAVVTDAILSEVSLVVTPCNQDCFIREREEFNELTPMLVESINKLQRIQQLLNRARNLQ